MGRSVNTKTFLMLAEDLLSGIDPGEEAYSMLADLAPHDVFACLPGADMIRDYYFGREIQLCTIANGKSGRCTEDCSFCSQSAFSKTDAPSQQLKAAPTSEIEPSRLAEGIPAWQLFQEIGLCKTRGEARRLIQQGGAYINEKRLEAFDQKIGSNDLQGESILLSAGKKRFHRIRVKI